MNQVIFILSITVALIVGANVNLSQNFHENLLKKGSAQITIELNPLTLVAFCWLAVTVYAYITSTCENVVIRLLAAIVTLVVIYLVGLAVAPFADYIR